MRTCEYCNKLHKAINNQNYCSKSDDELHEVSTNAYYFKSNNLASGKHLSRLSVRTISDGFQEYKINNMTHVLDKDHYMVINQGQEFDSELRTVQEVEGFVIAFHPFDLSNVMALYQHGSDKLLDNPFDHDLPEFFFPTHKIQLNQAVNQIMANIKANIQEGNTQLGFYESMFYDLLDLILRDHQVLKNNVASLSSKKKATKQEIFKRVNRAREYMDAHISENLSLTNISKIAEMSPYHFHRSFRLIFQKPIGQYIQQNRLEKSKFLLRDSYMTIAEILNQVGYTDQSAFARAFKKNEGLSPRAYRIAAA